MKERSLYLKTALVGLSIGVVLGLSACGTNQQPEINLNESENLEDEGMYLETPEDESGYSMEPEVEEPQQPDVPASEEPSAGEMTDASHFQMHAGMFDEMFEAQGETNLMYSPLSLDYVVGMLSVGASDEARSAMSVYLGKDLGVFTGEANAYIKGLPDTVEVANGIFLNGTDELNANTKETLTKQYFAGIEALDFASADAVAHVDAWCDEHTHGMITHLFDDMSDMDAAVVNALYFHQDWAEQIRDESVWTDDFTNGDGSVSSVEMMHFDGDGYFTTQAGQGFVKYYEGGRYCFVGMQPFESVDFTLSDLGLWNVMPDMADGLVTVSMPEFSFENDMNLSNVLAGDTANLGILFSDTSFPYFFANEDNVAVSSVIQKTKIEVDRKGTKAAAVTGAAMDVMAVLPDERMVLEFNRPFAFMIYDCEMGMPLFMGKVTGL